MSFYTLQAKWVLAGSAVRLEGRGLGRPQVEFQVTLSCR